MDALGDFIWFPLPTLFGSGLRSKANSQSKSGSGWGSGRRSRTIRYAVMMRGPCSLAKEPTPPMRTVQILILSVTSVSVIATEPDSTIASVSVNRNRIRIRAPPNLYINTSPVSLFNSVSLSRSLLSTIFDFLKRPTHIHCTFVSNRFGALKSTYVFLFWAAILYMKIKQWKCVARHQIC